MSAELEVSDQTLFVGNFEAAAITTSDIPLNQWGWFFDTVNLKLFIVRNRAGILYAVEANPL